MTTTINWTRDGRTGISTDGWMIRRTADNAFDVFDADDNYAGRFDNRDDAAHAVRVGQAV
jgi:hypothetical protein